jgi:hypothetical protein
MKKKSVLNFCNGVVSFNVERMKYTSNEYDHYVADKYCSKIYKNEGDFVGKINKNRFPHKLNVFLLEVIGVWCVIRHIFNFSFRQVEIIHISFVEPFYVFLLPFIKKNKLVVTVFGSDFYRYKFLNPIRTPIYKRADVITFSSRKAMNDFGEYYKSISKEKLILARFGSDNFHAAENFLEKMELGEAKKTMGFPLDKTIVFVGYNGVPIAQHLKIIGELSKLPQDIKDKLFVVIPVSSVIGDVKTYLNNVKASLRKSGIEGVLFEKWLTIEEMAYFRKSSEILINLPKSDQFSSSMIETLYCGNIVITGSWLPYEELYEGGVIMEEINEFSKLPKILEKVINEKDQYIDKFKGNIELVPPFISWEFKKNDWLKSYSFLNLY